MTDYIPNGGQTGLPIRDNIHVRLPAFTPAPRPRPELAAPVIAPAFAERGFVLGAWSQHFLAGVTAEMMDWWWANMEKGYYLWAPGAHKRFSWVKAPGQVGFLNSVHCISEAMVEGKPVFGGDGVMIHRLGLDWFPFTESLSHVIVEGVFNDLGEFIDMTVHMWDSCEGGTRHITAAVASTTAHEPPHFVKEMLAENPEAMPVAPSATDHAEYEASRWPQFLPQLYALWQGHPDPTQNVACDLTVEPAGEYRWRYTHENGPVVQPE